MSAPLYLPETAESEANLPQVGEPERSPFSAFGVGLKEGLITGPTNALIEPALQQAIQEYNPGKFVAPNEVPPHFASMFPKGVSENVLNDHQEALDNEMKRQDKLASIPDGFFKSAFGFTGGIVGSLIDPINAATTAIAPETLGILGRANAVRKLAEGTENLIGKTATEAVSRPVEGATAGALVGVPMSAGQVAHQQNIGEKADALDFLSGVGEMSLLGGAIGTASGVFRIFHGEAEAAIRKSASVQMAADKQLDIAPIMQQSIYEGVQNAIKEGNLKPEVIEAASTELTDKIAKVDEKLEKLKSITPDENLPLTRLNDALAAIKEHQEAPTEKTEARLKDYQKFDYFNKIIDAASTDPILRTESDRKVLSDFLKAPEESEKMMLDNNIKTLQEHLNESEKSYESRQKSEEGSKESSEESKVLKNKIDALREEIKMHEERRAQLEKLPENISEHNKVNRLKLLRQHLSAMKDTHDAVLKLVADTKPVNKTQIQATFEKLQNVEGDAFINAEEAELTHHDEMTEDEELNEVNRYRNEAQALKDAGKISEEDFKAEEEMTKKEAEAHASLKETFKNLINCLRGK